MKVIGAVTITIFLMIYTTVLNGWALAKLWGWFIVPTLHAPALGIPSAIGISLVVSYLTYQYPKEDPDEEFLEVLLRGGIHGTFKPLFAVFFGWIVKFWM